MTGSSSRLRGYTLPACPQQRRYPTAWLAPRFVSLRRQADHSHLLTTRKRYNPLKEPEATMLSSLFTDDQTASNPIFLPFSLAREAEALSLLGKCAVIVEDEGITQLQLRKLLRSEGIKVVGTASDGQEGVELVLKERPDFVLM